MGDLIWNGLSHDKGLPTLLLKVQRNSYCPYIVLFRTTATMFSSDLHTEKWDKNYCSFSKVFTVVCKGLYKELSAPITCTDNSDLQNTSNHL